MEGMEIEESKQSLKRSWSEPPKLRQEPPRKKYRPSGLIRELFPSTEESTPLTSPLSSGHFLPETEEEPLITSIVYSQEEINTLLKNGHTFLEGCYGAFPDDEEALDCFKTAADAGSSEGAYRAGLMIAKGWGAEQNIPLALEYYTKAGQHAGALYYLGRFYGDKEEGRDIPRDRRKAEKFLMEASKMGHKKASNSLANIYDASLSGLLEGSEKEKKKEMIFKLYQQASEKGNNKAHYNLAKRYLEGRGCKKDERKAVDLFSRIVHNKKIRSSRIPGSQDTYRCAQYFLGKLYLSSQGVPQDEAKAMAHYEKATEVSRDPNLFYFIGSTYNVDYTHDKRIGVKSDPPPPLLKRAQKFLELALELGHPQAEAELRDVENKLGL
jgi:TPR repeat protein